MERRKLLHQGTALGTALMTGLSADAGDTHAPGAALSLYQGAVTLPGGNSVALTLAVRGSDATGTLHTEVPFLLEGRVRDGAVTAQVVSPYDLDRPAGALAGCADARGGMRGQLTILDMGIPFEVAPRPVSSTAFQRCAGAYRGDICDPETGQARATHETTLSRSGAITMSIRPSRSGSGRRVSSPAPAATVRLLGFSVRVNGHRRIGAVVEDGLGPALLNSGLDKDTRTVIAIIVLGLAQGGTPLGQPGGGCFELFLPGWLVELERAWNDSETVARAR